MKMNLSRSDREFRLLVTIATVALYLTHIVSGTISIILLVVGCISLLTSYAGVCPIYSMLGINSRRETEDTSPGETESD